MRQVSFVALVAAVAVYSPGGSQAAPLQHGSDDPLTVTTLTGTFTGVFNEEYPNVREFRSIPYAQPPVGPRRWLPPAALAPSGRHSYARRYPSSCPQYLTKTPSLWNANITNFAIGVHGQSLLAGVQAQTSSEDCLKLAIWTPASAANASRPAGATTSSGAKHDATALLPVALFIPGGDFQMGGVDVPYQMPAPLVARRGDLIVVTHNYRVNIFGFPNAAGLHDQNLGLLDTRMAVEWLHANIRAFGGDPDRIVLWGQSAGAVAADIYNYAFYDDPLIAGSYLMSGTAAVAGLPADPAYSNFSFVARQVGCDFGAPGDPTRDVAAELACMRAVPADLLSNVVGQYAENGTTPRINFRPVPDERVYFANFSDRASRGLVAARPALVSTTANEEAALYPYPVHNLTAGPYMPAVDKATLAVFVCPAANTTRWRGALSSSSSSSARRTTYRYQYAGNFSAVTPYPWMGAYHASDIPMGFGTLALQPASAIPAFADAVKATMQDHVAAYIADPENGLRNRGWLPDDGSAGGGFLMRFAAGTTLQRSINSLEVDGACYGQGVYDNSPQS
ncbi:Carboxylesterase, type B [Niveomyces insectorum RCEF 264]|uniref:Carboxylic ester hydrolase n=1 Tax=Niveomyces insectorum RCEF 264 TaxID=1081102 RepID=A0A167VQE2_9HYPO|nr:Carboxylesterase, type B [Niveomyces insectorum RCEF 264]